MVVLFSLVFCRFSKRAFCKSATSTGKSGRLRPGKLQKLIGHCFDIQGEVFFQTPTIFIDSPRIDLFYLLIIAASEATFNRCQCSKQEKSVWLTM